MPLAAVSLPDAHHLGTFAVTDTGRVPFFDDLRTAGAPPRPGTRQAPTA